MVKPDLLLSALQSLFFLAEQTNIGKQVVVVAVVGYDTVLGGISKKCTCYRYLVLLGGTRYQVSGIINSETKFEISQKFQKKKRMK